MFPNSYILLQTFKVLMRIVENFPKLAAAEFPGIARSTFFLIRVIVLDVNILSLSLIISCEACARSEMSC